MSLAKEWQKQGLNQALLNLKPCFYTFKTTAFRCFMLALAAFLRAGQAQGPRKSYRSLGKVMPRVTM